MFQYKSGLRLVTKYSIKKFGLYTHTWAKMKKTLVGIFGLVGSFGHNWDRDVGTGNPPEYVGTLMRLSSLSLCVVFWMVHFEN
jgi:hypothetical protein